MADNVASIRIAADISDLTTKMHQAQDTVGSAMEGMKKSAETVKNALEVIGISFSARELYEKINSVTESMAKLQDASEKTGASVENMSKLKFFADVSGSNIDSVTQAMAKLSKNMASAGNDTLASSQAFKFLGLSAKDAAGNLKDPSVLFGEISQKLIGYERGAGKSALATAMLGKSGAELLPMLKKMAELGDIEASVTTEQAAAAEEYQIEVARLNQQKEILWNTVVGALLPSMKTFVGVLLDASRETDSLGGSIKGLAVDKRIENWADNSALAVGYLVDVLKGFSIAAEISAKAVGAIAATTTESLSGSLMTRPSRVAAVWAAFREDANQTALAYSSLTDKIKTAIAERKAAEEGGAWSGPVDQYGQPIVKKRANFSLGDAAKGAAELKLYTSALQNLEQMLGKVNSQSEVEKVIYQTTAGSLQKLTEAHKSSLISVAAEIDARKKIELVLKTEIEYRQLMEALMLKGQALTTGAVMAGRDQVSQYQFETSLIGKTADQMILLNAERRIDLNYRQQLKALGDVYPEGGSGMNAAIVRLDAATKALHDGLIPEMEKRIALEREWSTGAAKAYDDYISSATNAAKQTQDAWAATFKGMEDAAFNFFRHGILSATDFINTLKDQLARLAAQKFTVWISGAVGLGGALGMTGTASAGQGGGAVSGLSAVQALKGVYDTITAGYASTLGTGVSAIMGTTAGNAALGTALTGSASSSAAAASAAAQAAGSSATTASSMASMGSSVGTAAGYAGGIAAGYTIGTAISGQYGSKATVIAGTIIGSIWGPIGAAVGGAIGGLVNRAFGMGDVKATSQGIEGSFSGSGFAGNNFTNMHQDGGWFRSDKNWKDSSALDSATTKQFSQGYAAVQASAASAARSLGLSADTIANYSESISLTLTSDTAANEKIITKVFVDLGDHLASAVAPGLSAFAKDGETAGVTLSRLSTSITTANAWLSMLRNRLFDVSMAGADAASKLEDAFGSLDNFTAASKAFYETYYTEGERAARSQDDMSKALALVNLTLPDSKEGLKALAATLDLNTESGRNAYAVLLAIAPEFATTADSIAKLAKDASDKLMATFTGGGLLVPALDMAKLKVNTLTTGVSGLSGEMSFINSIMGDATSTVIGFRQGTYTLDSSMTASQLSAGLLNEEIVALQGNSDKARIDFVGLSAALEGVNTETFVTTMGMVFSNLATRIKGTIDAISAERIAVAQAALQIINPTVLSLASIQRGVAAINTMLPGNGGMLAAQNVLGQADAAAALKQAAVDQAQALSPSAAALDAARATLGPANARVASAQAQMGRPYGPGNFDYLPGQDPALELQAAQAALTALEAAYMSQLSTYNSALGTNAAQVAAAQTELSAATANQTTTANAARQAAIDYSSALQNFAIDASKSVGKLTALREETVKYYEAQKQLADLMATSAAGLRKTVADYNFSQKMPEQQLADLQGQYASAYSTAMSVQGDGATLASYGDKLNSLLAPLIAKLTETGNTNLIASYLAEADSVASLIEKTIPVNYQQDSLAMLGNIDATLAALDSSSKSAEKIISDAVNAGSALTASGLRGIIYALGGVPAFAGGGYHAGGLRMVGENGPELEVTGPSRIFNASQLRGMGAGSGGNADVVAELRALRADNANIRAELRAIAVATVKTAKQGDRLMPAGDALQVRVIA